MDKPVISISIATHNNGVYLNKAISSCLEQDFKLPYEVIVIADACNDNTKEVVESLMKTHKNLFYYEVNNKCVLKNRIYASKIAKGEFLMFLDGDDYFAPNALSVMYDAITKYDVDLVNANFSFVRRNGISKYPFTSDALLNRNEALKALFEDITFRGYMHTKIFKTSIFRNMEITKTLEKIDLGNLMYEDILLNFYYILSSKKVKCIKDTIHFYNKTNPSSMTSSGYRRVADNVTVRNLIRYKIEQLGDEDVRKTFLKTKGRINLLITSDFMMSKFPNRKVKQTIKKEVRNDLKNIFSKKYDVAKSLYVGLIHINEKG